MIFKCLKCNKKWEYRISQEAVKGTSGERGETAMCYDCAPLNIFAPFIPDVFKETYEPRDEGKRRP